MASTFFVRSALLSLAATGLLVSASSGAFADPKERPSTGALNGRRIFVSAGHGKHWKDATGTFSFDRGLTHGVREDISNAQTCIDFLIPMLIDAGAEVVTGRERSYQTNEVILDNDANGSPDYTESGAWNNGSAPGYRTSTQDGFGLGTYRHASTVTGAPTAIARFTPDIPEAGRYPVYLAWTANSNRPADALVKVNHAGGTTEVRLDQRSQGSRWFFCGSFFFDAGRQGSVEVTNSAGQAGKAVIADAVRFGSGMGSIIDNGRTSGIPRWQEHGRYKALYSGGGHLSSFSHLRTVPEFANWWGGHDAYIMWHSNAGGGKGTVSFYYDSNHALSPESRKLAEAVHRGVIADAKHHDPNWTDRGFRDQLANWTEMFYSIAHRPVMLCEVAFHDHVDDAEDLRDPKFRRAAARGAVKGFIRYFNGANASVPPVPPTGVQVVNAGGGIMRVTWSSAQDPVDSAAAAPSGARVYLSLNGRGFDDGWAVTSGQSFDVSGVQPGETLSVKVTQTNAGGESRPSEVLCARRPVGGNAPEFLIVSGFDRLDERVNVRDRVQTFDYVRQHAEGLAGAGDFAFDSASNEAVVSGAVQLDAYQAVVWVLGLESTVDKTFDSAERTLVSSYLAGGGKLIASGAEIAWDLDHKGADRTWFRQTFGAAYGADDAKTYQGAGEGGTLFGGVNFTFDDGSKGTYNVAFPDVFTVTSILARAQLRYQPAGVAAVHNGEQGTETMLFGFPLETVPFAERVALLDTSIRTLGITIGGSTGGSPGTQNPGTGNPGTGTPGTGTPGGNTGGTTTPGQTGGTTGEPEVVAIEKTSTGCSAGSSDPRGLLPFLTLLLTILGTGLRRGRLKVGIQRARI